MERFKSKRNKVYLQGGLVCKERASLQAAKEEARFLEHLAHTGVRVPKVLEVRGNILVMEYIRGETLPDFLVRMTAAPDDALLYRAAQNVCLWLESFYISVKHCQSGESRGDVNGRNFIITHGPVFGVDFEEHCFGPKEQDFGRLIAFIETYDSVSRHVRRMLTGYLREDGQRLLSLDAKQVDEALAAELVAMGERRKTQSVTE